jgi:ubiquinone/menaquinone biosynthesis C-methylase UbiE
VEDEGLRGIRPYNIPLPTELVSFFSGKSAKTVLEVGCGYGRVCFFLHEKGFEVTGVDVDREQVQRAQEEKKSRGVDEGIWFVVNDAGDLCFPAGCFDVVTVLGVLTLVPRTERLRIMRDILRVLKPCGYVLVEEFGRTWRNSVYRKRYKDDAELSGEPGTFAVRDEQGRILHFSHHFTRQELRGLLDGFKVVQFESDVFTSYYHKNWVTGYVVLAQKRGS